MNRVEMMRLAERVALQSVCKRAQVGAVVVTVTGRVYTGWNLNAHEPSGCCEDQDGKTLPDVIHAEDHALGFVDDGDGAVIYVTRQPCIKCARLIVNAGIKTVYYRDADDKVDGLEHLLAHGVTVNSGWLKEQMRARTLEQVQKTWAERSGQDANTTSK
jgi:dCMP deaminase